MGQDAHTVGHLAPIEYCQQCVCGKTGFDNISIIIINIIVVAVFTITQGCKSLGYLCKRFTSFLKYVLRRHNTNF